MKRHMIIGGMLFGLVFSLLACSSLQTTEVEGEEIQEETPGEYVDTGEDYRAKEEIEYMRHFVALHGDDDDYFHPEEKITRAQLAATLAQFFQWTLEEETSEINDIDENFWAYEPLQIAHSLALFSLDENENIRPDEEVTFGEFVLLFGELYDIKGVSATDEETLLQTFIQREYIHRNVTIEDVITWEDVAVTLYRLDRDFHAFLRDDYDTREGFPIIAYHHILREEENKEFTDASSYMKYESFIEQMDVLYENGFYTATLEEIKQYVEGEIDFPQRAVAITFDDGSKTNYTHAYDVLKERGFRASAYIITSRITEETVPFDPDERQFLSAEEIEKMTDVFEIGSHSHQMHHFNEERVAHLITRPYEEAKADLEQTLPILDEIRAIAYPFGQYDERLLEIVAELDFDLGFTTKVKHVRPGDPPYELGRKGMNDDVTIEEFKAFVGL